MHYVTTCKHKLFWHLYQLYFMYFKIVFQCILLISSFGKVLLSYVFVNLFCVGAEKTTLMSVSDVLDPYSLRRKMEKTRSVKEEMYGRVLISRKNRHFSLYK